MKQLFLSCIALLFAVSFGCSQPTTSTATPPPAGEILGDWEGTLSIQGQQLSIIFHFTSDNNQLKGTMDSPQQGAFGLPCTEVQYDNQQLVLQLSNLGIAYEGTLDQGTIEGTFRQGGMEFPLTLQAASGSAPAGPQRPQTPQAPFSYASQDVVFPNPSANLQLAGTLTIPEGCQNCPAVVLISGSGPQDRNETLMGHQPFWVIADHLSRHGVAVLRFDDRGVADSEGDFKTATSADFMTDVAAAVAFLKQQ